MDPKHDATDDPAFRKLLRVSIAFGRPPDSEYGRFLTDNEPERGEDHRLIKDALFRDNRNMNFELITNDVNKKRGEE